MMFCPTQLAMMEKVAFVRPTLNRLHVYLVFAAWPRSGAVGKVAAIGRKTEWLARVQRLVGKA